MQPRATALVRDEQLAGAWRVDRRGADLAVLYVGDRDAIEGDRAREVERAVQRIDDPEPRGLPELPVGALLGEDRDRGVVPAEPAEDLELRGVVRGRGEVRAAPLARDDRDVVEPDRFTDRERGLGGERREPFVAAYRRAGHQRTVGQRACTRSRKSLRSNGFAMTSVIPRRRKSSEKWPTAALMKRIGIFAVERSARRRS